MTTVIVDEYEKMMGMPEDMNAGVGNIRFGIYAPIIWTAGLHISVVRADAPIILISDRFCILENTIDSAHLYAYIPISPRTALLLVNSEYYFDEETFYETEERFGEKYGDGTPDEYLSDLFGAEVDAYEDRLFCEYYTQPTMAQRIEKETNSIYIRINDLPKEVFRLFNSIYCEDGEMNYLLESEHFVRDTNRYFFMFCHISRVFLAFCSYFACYFFNFKCDIVFQKVRKPETKHKNPPHLNTFVRYIIISFFGC